MICDRDLLFSDSQALTAAAASTNIVDLRPLASAVVSGGSANARNLGAGDELYWFLNVEVALTDSGSNSTVTVDLQTDDNAAFSSQATVATLMTIPAVTAAGTKYMGRLPIASTVAYESFIRIYYTMNTGDLTTGTVSAGIVKDLDQYASFVGGFSTGT